MSSPLLQGRAESMRRLFFVGFSLLPMWAAIALIAYAFAVFPPYQAGMTLWVLLPAIPACAVTYFIAAIATLFYRHTKGDHARKLGSSAGFVAFACLTLGLAGTWYVIDNRETKRMIEHERARAERFVRDNAEVQKAVGRVPAVSTIFTTFETSRSLPSRYEVSVHDSALHAIVDVNRTSSPSTFVLRCLTQRTASRDPCAK